MVSWVKGKIPLFLQWLLLIIPINIYIIGDWLGSGIQWLFFRYQLTYLGPSLIFINQDLNYVFNSLIGVKTGLSISIWVIGLIFIVLSLLLSSNIPGKAGTYPGILIILASVTFLISDFVQYGIFLHGPGGLCIPIGIPFIFVTGWWMYADNKKKMDDTTHPFDQILSIFSSIKTAAATFFTNHTPICIFLILYFVYNTIYIVNTNGDTIPATFLPLSILQYHNLFFDQFGQMAINSDTSYGYLLINNHYYSLFPIVTPVLVTPIYAVSLFLFNALSVPLTGENILLIAKTSAVIIAALSGVFVYWVIKELFSHKIALLSTFLYAFATSTWSISSQALWQHGLGELLLIIMLYVIIRNEKTESTVNIFILGILSGLLIFNRPPDAVLIIPIFYYIIRFYRKKSGYYAIGGIASGLPFLLYNLFIFGTIFGGYKENFVFYAINGDFIIHFMGLLISPNVGLFIFSPFLVFSILGYFRVRDTIRQHVGSVLLAFGPAIILDILVYSFFGRWYASIYCYGPRFLTGILPVLIIYFALFFRSLFTVRNPDLKKRLLQIVVLCCIVLSVFIHFIGVYYYVYLPEKGMDDTRAWDWNDSIITGSFAAGYGKNITITMHSFTPLPPVFTHQFKSSAIPP